MRVPLLVVALVSAVLAGCAAPAPTSTDDSFSKDLDDQLQATATTGVIRGVVIDATVTPIADALVTLIGTGVETRSNPDGFFGFGELEPGTYFLEVSKIGFSTVQASASVEAGVETPPAVRVQLAADPSAVPYVSEFQWTGRYTCSTAAFQVCPFVEAVACIAGACGSLPDDFIAYVPIDKNPAWINSELIWESTQPAGEELDFYLESVDKNDTDSWTHRRSVEGVSPLLLTIDGAEAEGYGLGTANDLKHRVFPALTPTTLVFLEQDFEVIAHAFYNYLPPEGWQFTVDGQVPAPPA